MPIVESKEAAHYTDDGSPAEHCGNCAHYLHRGDDREGYCQIVAGVVRFSGWCRHWRAALAAAE